MCVSADNYKKAFEGRNSLAAASEKSWPPPTSARRAPFASQLVVCLFVVRTRGRCQLLMLFTPRRSSLPRCVRQVVRCSRYPGARLTLTLAAPRSLLSLANPPLACEVPPPRWAAPPAQTRCTRRVPTCTISVSRLCLARAPRLRVLCVGLHRARSPSWSHPWSAPSDPLSDPG